MVDTPRLENESGSNVKATNSESLRHRVLIAEDNDQVRRMLVRVLSGEGFDVLGCPDGQEAIATLEASLVDVVITDIEMPHVDGFGVLEWVKRHRPRVQSIVITGLHTVQVKARCQQLGAVTSVAKPLDVSELLTHVRALALRRPPVTKSEQGHQRP